MTLKITLLGTGSSGGVPRVGGDWGACDPQEPKNRRRRCSVLVELWRGDNSGGEEGACTSVLVDTSPDLREQLLAAKTQRLDAVLYTHDHGDQTHGIDDLRAIAYRGRARIPVYTNQDTQTALYERFKFCFETPKGRVHAPILDMQPVITGGDCFEIEGPGGVLSIKVIEVGHGSMTALGFVFNDKIAYTPDVHSIDDKNLVALSGINTWVVDALRYHEHPTHAHADKTLYWAAQTCAQTIILTNLHIDMDYATLKAELPGAQVVGFDGMELIV